MPTDPVPAAPRHHAHRGRTTPRISIFQRPSNPAGLSVQGLQELTANPGSPRTPAAIRGTLPRRSRVESRGQFGDATIRPAGGRLEWSARPRARRGYVRPQVPTARVPGRRPKDAADASGAGSSSSRRAARGASCPEPDELEGGHPLRALRGRVIEGGREQRALRQVRRRAPCVHAVHVLRSGRPSAVLAANCYEDCREGCPQRLHALEASNDRGTRNAVRSRHQVRSAGLRRPLQVAPPGPPAREHCPLMRQHHVFAPCRLGPARAPRPRQHDRHRPAARGAETNAMQHRTWVADVLGWHVAKIGDRWAAERARGMPSAASGRIPGGRQIRCGHRGCLDPRSSPKTELRRPHAFPAPLDFWCSNGRQLDVSL